MFCLDVCLLCHSRSLPCFCGRFEPWDYHWGCQGCICTFWENLVSFHFKKTNFLPSMVLVLQCKHNDTFVNNNNLLWIYSWNNHLWPCLHACHMGTDFNFKLKMWKFHTCCVRLILVTSNTGSSEGFYSSFIVYKLHLIPGDFLFYNKKNIG